MLIAHFTFSKTKHGCKIDNLDSTLGVTQCAPPPPLEKILATSRLQEFIVL